MESARDWERGKCSLNRVAGGLSKVFRAHRRYLKGQNFSGALQWPVLKCKSLKCLGVNSQLEHHSRRGKESVISCGCQPNPEGHDYPAQCSPHSLRLYLTMTPPVYLAPFIMSCTCLPVIEWEKECIQNLTSCMIVLSQRSITEWSYIMMARTC